MNGQAVITMALAVALMSCKDGGGSKEVTRIAETECHLLETDIRAAAARHRQLAPAIDEHRLDPGQLERASSDLMISSVGNTPDARQARTRELEDRFRFCQQIRDLDQKAATDFSARLDGIHKGLNPDIASGSMPTAAATADLLDQLAELVHQVNARPLKR